VDDVAVFKSARLRFVAVANEVNRLGVVRRNEAPLNAGGEACSTTTAEAGGFDFVDDLLRFHAKTFLEHFVATIFDVSLNASVPTFTVDIFKNEAVLICMRLLAGKVGDIRHEKRVFGSIMLLKRIF